MSYYGKTYIERASYSVIRIETIDEDGKEGCATGSLFTFKEGHTRSFLITNKHVIEESVSARFFFVNKDPANPEAPKLRDNFSIELNDLDKYFIPHPEPDIDLCIIPYEILLFHSALKGKNFFGITNTIELLPVEVDFNDLDLVEEVKVIGFPDGIFDLINNRPILKSGVTATDYRLDYDGKPEFLIDCAIYPGSSGSPVFIYTKGTYMKSGSLHIGSRLLMLGIVHSVYSNSHEGEIIKKPIPVKKHETLSLTEIPNNLGIVVKSHKILDFMTLI